MRDLLAETWLEMRTAAREPHLSPTRRPNRLPRPITTLAILLALVSLGAVAYSLEWSGKKVHTLSVEEAHNLLRDPQTPASQKTALVGWLGACARRGVRTLMSARKHSNEHAQHIAPGIVRLETVLAGSKPNRVGARRYPAWLTFADATTNLSGPPAATERTWDSVEVIVYQLEEVALTFRNQAIVSGQASTLAKTVMAELRNQLSVK